VVGDYELSRNNHDQAIRYWRKAVSLEIPRMNERDDILNKIKQYDKGH
jgi:hypothetical protein